MIYKVKISAIVSLLFLATHISANSIIAIVNDDVITWNSISKDIETATTKGERLSVVHSKIDLVLQMQQVKDINLEPSDDNLVSTLKKIAKQNSLTFDQLKSLTQYDEIVIKVSNQLALNSLKDLVLKDLNFAPTQDEIDSELSINPSPKNLLKQIKVSQIAINTIDTSSGSLSKDELISKLLTKLKNDVESGSSFSELAKMHSQAPSYKTGGLSGWLNYSELPTLFKDILDNMPIDKISDPFNTGNDWRIIKISDERSVDPHVTKIISKLELNKINNYYNDWIKELWKDAYIDIFEDKL